MFKIIAGPCVIESKELVDHLASELKRICSIYPVDFYFKASFDKANRSSLDSFRGPGMVEGLEILKGIKNKYDLKIVTDIHEPYQAQPVSEVADIIQIPAFLCRQTDLLVAAAKTGKLLNIKKAQFLAPWDMKYVVDKIQKSGNNNIMLCERGTVFGYNNLVVDFTSIIELKKFGFPVLFDATHSVQKPGGLGKTTGGNREYVKYLSKAAVVTGVDGLFFEVHPDPDNALSDGPNMISISDFEKLMNELMQIKELINKF